MNERLLECNKCISVQLLPHLVSKVFPTPLLIISKLSTAHCLFLLPSSPFPLCHSSLIPGFDRGLFAPLLPPPVEPLHFALKYLPSHPWKTSAIESPACFFSFYRKNHHRSLSGIISPLSAVVAHLPSRSFLLLRPCQLAHRQKPFSSSFPWARSAVFPLRVRQSHSLLIT